MALDDCGCELIAEQPTSSEVLRRKEQSLWAVLPRLSDAQAHALLMKYEGAPLSEIAAALGRHEAAASNVLYRAIRTLSAAALKQPLEPELPEPFVEDMLTQEVIESADRRGGLGQNSCFRFAAAEG